MPAKTRQRQPAADEDVGPRGDFIAMLRGELERTGLDARGLSRKARLHVNAVGELLNADHGPSVPTLVALGNYLKWDFNDVMALLGGREAHGVDAIASAIAARPALEHLFQVARQLDNDQVAVVARMAAAGWEDSVKISHDKREEAV